MATPIPPSTMKSWQYSNTKGGLEKNLHINPAAPVPESKADNRHLVRVIATALNPVDYTLAEAPIIGFLFRKPATPGIDFAGYIVVPATGSSLKSGQPVFGLLATPFTGGTLSEFILTPKESTVAVPNNISLLNAATMGAAGLTAYQSIVPKAKTGDKIFINGGSGGTGVFGIQIAKAIGCHVTTACSTANVELCRSLGADEVIDYKKIKVVEALKIGVYKYDLIVDNVGTDVTLYWNCHEYMKSGATYMLIARRPTWDFAVNISKMILWPGFLGGGKRKIEMLLVKMKSEDLEQVGRWMKEGKIKAIIDERYPFEQLPRAFERLKTGRAKGKIVVDVASEK